MLTPNCSDGKEAKEVMKQIERSSSINFIDANYSMELLCIISENQLRENIHKWLSPPDPSTNHNIACGTHHKKTAIWFFQGSIYQEWKSTSSLLWIHGKRAFCPIFPRHPDNTLIIVAGSGKSILWFVDLSIYRSRVTDFEAF